MLMAAAPAGAQVLQDIPPDTLDVEPPSTATASGRVITPAGEKVMPVPGVMVTLHRVGTDRAGPLDSVRTDADGRWTLRYARGGSARAVYFAAVIYRGIAYFSAPLHVRPREGDGDGEIVVFDTTTTVVPLTIRGHHIVVSAPGPDGTRKIVEVYELSNDTSVTIVGRDSLTAVWSTPLPGGAAQFAGGQGDVSPVALAARDGRVVMLAPFGPGIKQLSYSYTLPPSAFPLELEMQRYTGVLEVLLEEAGAQARSPTLRAQDTASTQGRTFKRFLSQGSPQGERVRITVPAVAAGTRSRVLVGLAVVIALAMIASLARALSQRGRATPPAESAPPGSAALLAAIATLDARYEAGTDGLTAERYAEERAGLKSSLVAALERERTGA